MPLAFLFTLLGKRAGAIGAMILVALLLAAVGVQTLRLSWAHHELHKVTAELKAERDVNDALQKANLQEHGAVTELGNALEQWKATAAKATEGWNAAIEQSQKYVASITALNTALRKSKDADNALPDCQKLLAVDLAAVCPGHADGVRARAHRLPGPGG